MSRRPFFLLKKMRWRVEWLGYLMLEYLLSKASLASIYKLGELVGKISYRLSPKYRGIVKRNLMMTLSRESLASPSAVQIEEVFSRNGGNLLTTIAASRKKFLNLSDYLEVENIESLEAKLDFSGAIIILGHMGNWELLTQLNNSLKGNNSIGALYRPLNNPYMNALILKRRKTSGMALISSRKPARPILELLKQKGVMCILSDQKIGHKGSVSSFFGQRTSCTRLPMILHNKTKAPVFVISMITEEPGRWKLIITPVDKPSQQGIMDALALGMERSLTDCFWFQDRWQDFPFQPFQQDDLGDQSIYKEKPLPGVLESRSILIKNPQLAMRLSAYPLEFWDEGASLSEAYFAIGDHPRFLSSCKKVGLKRGLITTARAVKHFDKN